MGVRAKRGTRWPDEYGNYEIVDTDGCHLFYVLGGSFGPDTEAVAERILAAINGDTVPAPTLPDEARNDAARRVAKWIAVHEATHGPDGDPRFRGGLGISYSSAPITLDDLRCLVAAAPTLPDDLPSWVSMHATATGADLIEHDPNGDEWERWWANEWWTDHADADDRRSTYLVRRRPVPVEPTTEKVPWWEAVERGLAVIGRDGEFVMDCGAGDVVAYLDGARWALMYDDASHEELKRPLADPDGMVTVLREDGAS